MESVNHICSCLNGLTEAQKKQADAIAGGNFEKLLAEFQILRTSSGEKNRTASSNNPFENSRASDIRDIFFLQQEKTEDASFSLEKFFSSSKSENQFENSRASDILNIFFLNQEKLKESDPQVFDNSSPLDLEKLRRDPATPREVPGFLEKRFEIFGPTIINRFL
ncbi:MAG: hypothetical protein ACI9UO_000505 [Nitrospinales bacterium]|jgi:hypothetical protein